MSAEDVLGLITSNAKLLRFSRFRPSMSRPCRGCHKRVLERPSACRSLEFPSEVSWALPCPKEKTPLFVPLHAPEEYSFMAQSQALRHSPALALCGRCRRDRCRSGRPHCNQRCRAVAVAPPAVEMHVCCCHHKPNTRLARSCVKATYQLHPR